MTPALRAYLLTDHIVGSFVVNAVLGGVLGAIVQPFVATWAIMDGTGAEAPIAAAAPQKSE